MTNFLGHTALTTASRGFVLQGAPKTALLTDDGTDTGAISMKVNGSSTAVEFYRQVPSGAVWDVYTTTFTIGNSTAALVPTQLGNITAVTNGLYPVIYDGSSWSHLMEWANGSAVTGAVNNVNLANYATSQLNLDGGSGFRYWVLTFDFERLFGGPIRLTAGQRIGWQINDNLTTMGATPTASISYVAHSV